MRTWLCPATRIKSPARASRSAPVPESPVATRASSALATLPTTRAGKLAFTSEPITLASGFCVQATTWIPASRPRWVSLVSSSCARSPPSRTSSASSSTTTTIRGETIRWASRRSISEVRRSNSRTASSAVPAMGASRCGRSWNGARPRCFMSMRASWSIPWWLWIASEVIMDRASAVLPEPVVPETSTCEISGAGRESRTGKPSSSSPSSGAHPGVAASLLHSGNRRTGPASERGMSMLICPSCRWMRQSAAFRQSAISSDSVLSRFIRAPNCGTNWKRTSRGVTSPPATRPGTRWLASTISILLA